MRLIFKERWMCRGGRVMNRTGPSLIRVRARIGTASQLSYAVRNTAIVLGHLRRGRRRRRSRMSLRSYRNVSAVSRHFILLSWPPTHHKTDWTDRYVRPIYTLHLFMSVWFCFWNLCSLKLNMRIDLLVYFYRTTSFFN